MLASFNCRFVVWKVFVSSLLLKYEYCNICLKDHKKTRLKKVGHLRQFEKYNIRLLAVLSVPTSSTEDNANFSFSKLNDGATCWYVGLL